jgi:hypothetical protein
VVRALAILLAALTAATAGCSAQSSDEVSFVVSVNASEDPTRGWLTEKAPGEVPARPGWSDDWRDWAGKASAVPLSANTVQLTVQGRVTLTQIRVKVVKRRPALKGTEFVLVGGDPASYPRIEANLDKEPVAVAPPAEETFGVTVQTQECDCDWVVELSWSAEGRTGTRTIDNGGKPFRVTAGSSAVGRCVTYPDGTEKCETFQTR